MAFTLRNILRPGADNDLRIARGVLRHAGFFLPESPAEAGAETGAETGNPGASGRMDRALEAALRRFQRANLLEEDGVMRPFGPTMRRLLDLTDRVPAPEARRKVRFQTPIPAEAERRNEELRTAFFRRGTGEDFLDLGRRAMLDDQARALPELIDLADKIAERDAADGERFRALLLDAAQGISPEAAEAVRMGSAGLAEAKGVVRAPATSETAPLLRAAEKAEAPQAPAGPGRLPTAPRVTPEGDRARQGVPPKPTGLAGIKAARERETLEEAERYARQILSGGRMAGFDLSVANFKHYLDGTGTNRAMTRDEARALEPIKQAEIRNMAKFEKAITQPPEGATATSPDIARKLLALEDGSAVQIEDDINVASDPGHWDSLQGGDIDFALALGNVYVGAKGKIKARRIGDVIHVRGEVTHAWNDRYDFDGSTFGGYAKILEANGKAKTYDISSKWRQEIVGTVRIKDGKLIDPRFVWRDINPPDPE